MTNERAASSPHPVRAVVSSLSAAIAILFVLRWPVRAQWLYDWDSAQYALGAIEFDVYRHQPHPPGYPLWILLLRATMKLGLDANAGQIALSVLFSALSLWVFVHLARSLVRDAAVLVVAAAFAFAPGVALYGSVASTYAVDLLTSSAIAFFAARLWVGEKRLAPIACALLALLAGVRQGGALMMAPLLLVSVVRANRADLRAWLRTAIASIPVFLAWFLPVARLHGGVRAFVKFVMWSGSHPFRDTSVFYGASSRAHVSMLRDVAVWLSMDLAIVLVVTIALSATRRTVSLSGDALTPPARETPRWHRPAFYLCWLLPEALFVTLVHAPKPGYLLVAVPPLVLLAARSIDRSVHALSSRVGIPPAAFAAACALFIAASGSVIDTHAYENERLERASLDGVRAADLDTAAIVSSVRDSTIPMSEQVVIVIGGSPIGPNARTLRWYLPAVRLWTFDDDGTITEASSAGVRDAIAIGSLPNELRRIVWVVDPDLRALDDLRRAFPATDVAHRGRTIALLSTTLTEEPINAALEWGASTVHLLRPRLDRALDFAFETGFSPPERDGEQRWIWATGPRSELTFRAPRSLDAIARFTVSVSPMSNQRVIVEANGEPMATMTDLVDGTEIVVRFRAHAGINAVTFEFDRWNGHPIAFAPDDGRPLAVSFRSAVLELGGEPYVLLP